MKKVIIKVNGNEILFSNLRLNQELASLHSFSFNCQIESPNGVSLETYSDFYEKTFEKNIEITIEQKPVFEGIVTDIACINQYEHYIDFEVKGYCNAWKIDQLKVCKSFSKKKISDVFKALTQGVDTTINPIEDTNLHYTVQYNTTAFGMLQMLCKREGEWLHYDGKKIVIKKPDNTPIELELKKNELFNLKMDIKMPLADNKKIGYDLFKGVAKSYNAKKAEAKGNSIDKIVKGKQKIENKESAHEAANIPFDETSKRMEEKYIAKRIGCTTLIKGSTNNSSIAPGIIIMPMNNGKKEVEKGYVVTKSVHIAADASEYHNEFEAIPFTEKHPPYTDPEIKIEAQTTSAIVTHNEDKDGLSRIKVRFNWAAEGEESCWMRFVSPHAGTDKGFRFLPEVDDEVMVSFYNNNAEIPYAIGSVYSDSRKDGVKEGGNHIKKITTRTNRRIVFNDDDGVMYLGDSKLNENFTGNIVHLEKKGEQQALYLASEKDKDNANAMKFEKEKGVHIAIIEGGKETVEIKFDREEKKLKIYAKQDITIHAENNVNVKATNIAIEADKSIKIKSQKFELESDEIKIEAKMEMNVNGGQQMSLASAKTDVKGDMMLNLNGGAQAVLKGGVVMIN